MKKSSSFLKCAALLFACAGTNLPVAAQIYPAKTIDLVIPGGPYSDVQNTGAAITECSGCAQGVAHAYTWDGNNPGIAVYEPGAGVYVQSLPSGAWDPDIVFGLDGTSGVVVYELNGGVEYNTFTYTPGVLIMGSSKVLHTNAHHPNIDNPTDCGSRDPAVIVFETMGGGPDLKYTVGTLTGGFGTSSAVSKTGLTQSGAILDRFRPDVQVYDFKKYLFVAQGIDSLTGNDCIDLFDEGTSLQGFQSGNILLSGVVAHPRIDGVVDQVGLTYAYSVTYKDHNSIRHGMQDTIVTALQPISTLSDKPAIAYNGDYHDVVWPSDAVASPNMDLIGKGFFADLPDSFYKELNDVTTSGSVNKRAVSIAGRCEYNYASCWAADENIYYKEAIAIDSNYKKDPESDDEYQMFVYNPTGQLINQGRGAEKEDVFNDLPKGIYIVVKINRFNKIIEVQKLLK